MLTNTEIEAIRKRAEETTEGPWRIGRKSPNGLNNIGTMGGLLTAQTLIEEDAEFIAHAREDIPKLLAEIERISSVYKRLSEYYTHANGLLEDVHELLYDSIYNDHPTFGEVSEYLNVGGDE